MENINQLPEKKWSQGRTQIRTVPEEWKSASERNDLTKARRMWSHSGQRESSRRKERLSSIKRHGERRLSELDSNGLSSGKAPCY